MRDKKAYPRPPASPKTESYAFRPSSPILNQHRAPASRSFFSRSPKPDPSPPESDKIPWESTRSIESSPSTTSQTPPRVLPHSLHSREQPVRRPSSPVSTRSYTSSNSSARWSQGWIERGSARKRGASAGACLNTAAAAATGGWSDDEDEDQDDDNNVSVELAFARNNKKGNKPGRMRQAFGFEKKTSSFSLKGLMRRGTTAKGSSVDHLSSEFSTPPPSPTSLPGSPSVWHGPQRSSPELVVANPTPTTTSPRLKQNPAARHRHDESASDPFWQSDDAQRQQAWVRGAASTSGPKIPNDSIREEEEQEQQHQDDASPVVPLVSSFATVVVRPGPLAAAAEDVATVSASSTTETTWTRTSDDNAVTDSVYSPNRSSSLQSFSFDFNHVSSTFSSMSNLTSSITIPPQDAALAAETERRPSRRGRRSSSPAFTYERPSSSSVVNFRHSVGLSSSRPIVGAPVLPAPSCALPPPSPPPLESLPPLPIDPLPRIPSLEPLPLPSFLASFDNNPRSPPPTRQLRPPRTAAEGAAAPGTDDHRSTHDPSSTSSRSKRSNTTGSPVASLRARTRRQHVDALDALEGRRRRPGVTVEGRELLDDDQLGVDESKGQQGGRGGGGGGGGGGGQKGEEEENDLALVEIDCDVTGHKEKKEKKDRAPSVPSRLPPHDEPQDKDEIEDEDEAFRHRRRRELEHEVDDDVGVDDAVVDGDRRGEGRTRRRGHRNYRNSSVAVIKDESFLDMFATDDEGEEEEEGGGGGGGGREEQGGGFLTREERGATETETNALAAVGATTTTTTRRRTSKSSWSSRISLVSSSSVHSFDVDDDQGGGGGGIREGPAAADKVTAWSFPRPPA
ncbi:hypothetical protein JCM3766R1_003538 [Sporobolomyces carnicolor]